MLCNNEAKREIFEEIFNEKFKDEYPAHFHINILPEYQRVGAGGKLINALFEHYRNKGIKGVMRIKLNAEETKKLEKSKLVSFIIFETNLNVFGVVYLNKNLFVSATIPVNIFSAISSVILSGVA